MVAKPGNTPGERSAGDRFAVGPDGICHHSGNRRTAEPLVAEIVLKVGTGVSLACGTRRVVIVVNYRDIENVGINLCIRQ